MKKRITVMKKTEITDEEIRGYMDFENLLKRHQAIAPKASLITNKLIVITAAVVVLTASVLYVTVFRDVEKNTADSSATVVAKKEPVTQTYADSVFVETERTVTNETSVEIDQKNPDGDDKENHHEMKRLMPSTEASQETVNDDEKTALPTKPVYAQAEPADGYPALYEYFGRELKYPQKMVKDSVRGVVVVLFTINAAGDPEKLSIDESLGSAFDEEAIRLIRNMPKWKPATYNGKPVASRISLPITFQIVTVPNDSQDK